MQKFLSRVIWACLVLLLVSCQSSSVGAGRFPSTSSSPSYVLSLAQSVQDALMRQEDPVIAQVRVSTNQNVVLLSGYVKKIRQSDVAEQIARHVPGVQNVENHIIVRQ